MSRSKRQKQKTKRTATPQELQPQPRLTSPQRSHKHPLRTVVEIVGAIAAVIAIGGALYDALRLPEISAEKASSPLPFNLLFSVKNPSLWLSMRNVEWNCTKINIKWLAGGGIFLGGVMNKGIERTIEPREIKNYACSVSGVPAQPIRTLSIVAEVRYRTLGIDRGPVPVLFTWHDGKWYEGEILH